MALLLLFLVFVVAPLVELYVIVQVAQEIGVLETIAALIIVAFVGAYLVKAAGLAVLVRTQRQLAAGHVPTKELADGAIILVAGALMIAPGFVSDAIGLLLLLPPVRALVRRLVLRTYRRQVDRGRASAWVNNRVWSRVVVDVDARVDDPPSPPRPPRGELDG